MAPSVVYWIFPRISLSHRPQSNGIVERKNLNVLTHLRALLTTSLDVTTNWCSLLPIAQRICNATDVNSIGCARARSLPYGLSVRTANQLLANQLRGPYCVVARGEFGLLQGLDEIRRGCQEDGPQCNCWT
jgi:hypothetical protein